MIATAGLGTYSPTAVLLDSQTGIYTKGMPEHPDRAVVLTVYGATDAPKENLTSFNVQVWCRGLPNQPLDVDDLGDAIFNLLQGAEALTFGSVKVLQILRKFPAQMGDDANQRWERADNYVIDANIPATPGRTY